MDIWKATEIVEEMIHETLKKLHEEYKGEIKLTSKSTYANGRIVIKIKED